MGSSPAAVTYLNYYGDYIIIMVLRGFLCDFYEGFMWFKMVLKGRCQYTTIKEYSSYKLTSSYGVPQGSLATFC